MSTKNNTTKLKEKQYHHLTRDDRCKIETLINLKDKNGKRLYSNTYIANELGVNKSTISRELKNRIKAKINPRTGTIKVNPYNVSDAHNDYLSKRALSKANYILDDMPILKKFIEDKILEDKWAPDVIAGYIKSHGLYKNNGFALISTSTIYRAIHYNLLKVRKEDTRRMTKFEKSGKYSSKSELPTSKLEYSIELRPKDINDRKVFGHCELDTVIGKREGSHECLMTLTERKTRFEIIFKLTAKTKQEVISKFKKIKEYLENDIKEAIKSITTDNGSEFSGFLEIIKITNSKLYFCHPYASFEKGTNEKHNGMIRYFIPKGNLMEDYSNNDINNICFWMNNYPRKILDYKTPLEVLKEELNNNILFDKITNMQRTINV